MTSFQAKWGSPTAGSGGGLVTWSFAQYQGNVAVFSHSIAEGSFADAVRQAFNTWESVANIDFQEVVDTGLAHVDILLGWSFIDGPSGTLGIAHTSWSSGSLTAAEIEFDEEEFWVYSQNVGNYGVEAYGVALHEIGHAIGLEHTSDPTSIMYPIAYTSQMSANDIRDITFIYGTVFPPGFDALLYIASYTDLAAAFGANAEAGRQHWAQSGRYEGRTITFDPLEYVASYGDLASGLGLDRARATEHYLNFGWREGRTTSFDGLEYIASYADLIFAFGPDASAGASHFILSGRFEGRAVSFDGLSYIASHGDLIGGFGTNATLGTTHWISNGFFEGRTSTFDREQYLASNDDLVFGFGLNGDAAMSHWLEHGYWEGRSADSFDEAQYLANYADLQAAFGNDLHAATRHYIQFGLGEGRTDAHFASSGSSHSALMLADEPLFQPDHFIF